MGKLTDGKAQKAVERLWQHYDTYHHIGPEPSHLVRDEWVERFAVAGSPDEVINQVRRSPKFGFGELTIIRRLRNVCAGFLLAELQSRLASAPVSDHTVAYTFQCRMPRFPQEHANRFELRPLK